MKHVLGIDVGYAAKLRTTGLCLMQMDEDTLDWTFVNTGTDEATRMNDIRKLVPKGTLITGVGIDGPLAPELRWVGNYRACEALLTRGPFYLRGKPGQTSSGNGKRLHSHATSLAKLVLQLEGEGHLSIAAASHPDAIHQRRIVEAFPTAYLAALIPDNPFPMVKGRAKSDRYWEAAVEKDYLARVLATLVPGCQLKKRLLDITNHDNRAAFVCALTALGAAAGLYVAVGDRHDGDMMLPPRDAWGADNSSASWVEEGLRKNVRSVQATTKPPNFPEARVIRDGDIWLG